MKKYFLILAGLTISIILIGQEAISTAGGTMKNSTTEANWTIGEAITESYFSSKVLLTSGVNQPVLIISTLVESIKNPTEVSVYPNPTAHFVNISINGTTSYNLRLFAINGQLLYSNDKCDSKIQLNFDNYDIGVYIIEISNKIGKMNKFKIIKQ